MSSEVVLCEAECEWQGFVCPLQCSLAQVAAPGAAQLLRHCMGEQGWAQGNLRAPAPLTQHPASGETLIRSAQRPKETNTQLSDAGALRLPRSSLEIKHFQMDTDWSLILLFSAELTLPLMPAHSHAYSN